jgi:hypothetical protein
MIEDLHTWIEKRTQRLLTIDRTASSKPRTAEYLTEDPEVCPFSRCYCRHTLASHKNFEKKQDFATPGEDLNVTQPSRLTIREEMREKCRPW